MLITLLLDLSIELNPNLDLVFLKRSDGGNRCWFQSDSGIEFFHYIFILIMIFGSFCFYTKTAVKIYSKQHKNCQYNGNGECQVHKNVEESRAM